MKRLLIFILGLFIYGSVISQNDTIIEPVVNAGTLGGFTSSYFLDTTDFAVTKVWIVDVGYIGDQLSNGTIFAPFTAIQQAFDSCSVRDIVLVYPGTYPAEHLHPIIDSIKLLSLSGASQTFVALTASGGTGFDMDSEGMTIEGITFTGDAGFLIQLEGGEDAFTLRNCELDTEGSPSIGLNIGASGCSNMIVENNKFISETADGAIWMEKNVSNPLIRNNWFVGSDSASSYAIQTAGSTGGRYINNLIEGYASGIFLHTVTATSGGTANELIANNIIRNCSKGVRLGHSSMTVVMDSINVWNNLIYNCSFGIDVTDDAQVETETFNITGNNLQQNTVNKKIPGAAKPYNDANIIEKGFTGSNVSFIPESTFAYVEGGVYYDSDDKTLVVYNDEADVSMNVGEELFKRVRNASSALIPDGTPVYVSGAVGQLPTIEETDADAAATALFTGLSTHSIENNSNGYITPFGIVRGLDTDGSPYGESWSDGDQIYFSRTKGDLTNIRPTGYFVVCIGHVDYAHTSQGRLQIHPTKDWFIDLRVETSIYQTEQSDALVDVPSVGQWWVRDDAPNIPMFTDDDGTDHEVMFAELPFIDIDASNLSMVKYTLANGTIITESHDHNHNKYALVTQLSGSVYGTMGFADSTGTVDVSGSNYFLITNAFDKLWITGVNNGLTFAGDSIQVPSNGDYNIYWDISYSGSNPDVFHIEIFINGVDMKGKGETIRDMSTNNIGVGTGHTILNLLANDWFTLRIANKNNDNDPVFVAGNIIISKY